MEDTKLPQRSNGNGRRSKNTDEEMVEDLKENNGRPSSLLSDNSFSQNDISIMINSNSSTPEPVLGDQLIVCENREIINLRGCISNNTLSEAVSGNEPGNSQIFNWMTMYFKSLEKTVKENANSLEVKLKENANSLEVKLKENAISLDELKENTTSLDVKLDKLSGELKHIKKEVERNEQKIKGIERGVQYMSLEVKDVGIKVSNINDKYINVLEDVKVIKDRIVSTEENMIGEFKIIYKSVDEMKDSLQYKIMEEVSLVNEQLKSEVIVGLARINEKIELNEAKQLEKVETFGEDIVNRVKDITIRHGEKTNAEIGEKIMELQNKFEFMQIKVNDGLTVAGTQSKLCKVESLETLHSDSELNPPRKRNRHDRSGGKKLLNIYGNNNNRNSYYGENVVSDFDEDYSERRERLDNKEISPIMSERSISDFDNSEKRENDRMSRSIKQENAPMFNGYNTTAPQFISEAEQFFKSLDIRHEKVKLRSLLSFLRQSPLDWWKMTVAHTKTWNSFKDQFIKQYFGEYEIQKLESEWLNMKCKKHWNVEKFALKALKLQEILRANVDIDKQCHNVIQKLPIELRDYMSLLRFRTGTDFMKKLKDAMRVKEYAINYDVRQQTDDRYDRKSKYKNDNVYEYRDGNNNWGNNGNGDRNRNKFNTGRGKGYFKRYNDNGRAYFKRNNDYNLGTESFSFKDNWNERERRPRYNDGKGYDYNNRGKYRGYWRDRRDQREDRYHSDDENEMHENKRRGSYYRDDRYERDRGYNSDRETRNRSSPRRDECDRRNRETVGSQNLKDHSRKGSYKDQHPNNKKSGKIKSVGAIETEHDSEEYYENNDKRSENN